MAALRRGTPRAARPDQGFTLVEVIVAIVLLAMVSVGLLGLFVGAMKNSSGLGRRQAAVVVASQAMEVARSIPPQRPGDKLASGRSQTAVDAQWAVATDADLSQTDKVYDAAATGSSTPVLPLTSTTTVGGITYTVSNLVGSCWRPAGGGTCVKAAVKEGGSLELYRIIVYVTWSEGAGTSCSGGACNYSLASLVDVRGDPEFNLYATNASWPAPPVLHTLTATTSMNTPVNVDLAGAVTSGATPLVATTGTVTPSGTASVLPNTTTVTVTPVDGYWSGTDLSVPFTLTDPYGQSASGTLTVHVSPPAGPSAHAGTATTHRNVNFPIDLASFVSGGTGPFTYAITAGPSYGTITGPTGSLLTYRAGWPGTGTFTFRVTDTYGQSSSATVTVTVTW
jgi:prepilin-type N-terminal cleavage/methylation domain-containing protein